MSPVIDLSFEEVACWLPETVADPVAFENWIGNRLYGVWKESENKNWEEALMRARLFKIKPTLEEALKEVNNLPIILDTVQPTGILQVGNFGTIICPVGHAAGAEVNKVKIAADEIYILPAGKDQMLKVEIRLKGDLKIDKKNNFTVDVTGGDIGIIIDTRGRPLSPPELTPAGRERLLRWQKAFQK